MLKRKLDVYRYLAQKRIKRKLGKLLHKRDVRVYKVDDDFDSHLVDDLPLTLNRDPDPGAKFHQDAVH